MSRTVAGSGRDLDVGGIRLRRWNSLAFGPHAFQMESNRRIHPQYDSLPCRTGGHAARKIRRVSRVAGLGLFYDDQEFHGFSPACLKILLSVLGAKSSFGLPAIVTSPDLVGCLSWRWLPRCLERYQPSATGRLTRSRTFILSATDAHPSTVDLELACRQER